MISGRSASGSAVNQRPSAVAWRCPKELNGTSTSRPLMSISSLLIAWAASRATLPALSPCRTSQSLDGQLCKGTPHSAASDGRSRWLSNLNGGLLACIEPSSNKRPSLRIVSRVFRRSCRSPLWALGYAICSASLASVGQAGGSGGSGGA
jgi:hypothetical protein